jgi:hypothetical protein
MNRLDMAKEIEERADLLANLDKDIWKDAEKLRREFVNDYPIRKIRSMSLDEFVIGKGSENRSFCYRIEREMDSLGRILGATAFKFGVYYGRTNSDTSNKYRFSKNWGKTVDEAFLSIKGAIINLIEAAAKRNMQEIAKNRLSPMFKGKILFIYFPSQYAPIYSKRHLEYFLANLDISGSFNNNTEMQVALMKYRETWPGLLEQPIPLYMRLLYNIFNSPENPRRRKEEPISLPLLGDAVIGAEFIDQMPALSDKISIKSEYKKSEKLDFEKLQKQQKRTGDRGEAIVVALEEKRLQQAGKYNLANQINHVSQKNDSAVYDILSFDEDGTPRQIEVKATTANNLERGFYISSNELEQARVLPNYFLYLVFSTMSRKPRILPIKHPPLNSQDFELHAVNYHVTLKNK